MRFSIIARQGLVLLLLWLLAALVLVLAGAWPYSLPLFALALVTVYLYRDLPRRIPPKPNAIVSPLDGIVLSVEPGHDPYCEREAIRIEAKTYWNGPFVLRSPMEGKVVEQWFSPGSVGEDGKRTPPMMAMWIRSDEDDDLVLVVTPRSRRLRMSCRAHAGERVGHGRRCGFIPLGARIEVFLPVNARVQIEAGQKVSAGDSILAQLIHK
jgi:phosphatidylserine decarboxylase